MQVSAARLQRSSSVSTASVTACEGFSLIELLVVVAIILIIAAIAIPNLLRARISANEASAVANLRTITTASVVYNSTWSNGYPASLNALGGSGTSVTCDQASLIDPILATPPFAKSGYLFAYTVEGNVTVQGAGCGAPGAIGYLLTAVPQSIYTGVRSFCSSEPGSIHFDTSGSTAGSPTACTALAILQ